MLKLHSLSHGFSDTSLLKAGAYNFAVTEGSTGQERQARLPYAAEVEVRKLAGELVPVADIEAAWLSVAGAVRTRLLLIPTKVAPLLSC